MGTPEISLSEPMPGEAECMELTFTKPISIQKACAHLLGLSDEEGVDFPVVSIKVEFAPDDDD